MILVCMDRGDPHLYYGTKQQYFRGPDFKIIGVATTPPWLAMLQKVPRLDAG